ncbi:MAG: hypothetical protein SWH54_17780 [Thermodesulfobacteriota bacterium]|nr:hypothetical protein [Thermodesulfobacteriota bacterium]
MAGSAVAPVSVLKMVESKITPYSSVAVSILTHPYRASLGKFIVPLVSKKVKPLGKVTDGPDKQRVP